MTDTPQTTEIEQDSGDIPCPTCGLKKQAVTDIISRLHGELYQTQSENRRLTELLAAKDVKP